MASTKFRLNDINDDLAFVKRVIENDRNAVAFFLEVYSKPLMEYIGRSILKLMPLPIYKPRNSGVSVSEQFDEYSYGIGCYGSYYEFIAAKFLVESKLPQWDKLCYYDMSPRSRLYTYLSVITTRHFLKNHPDKEKAINNGETSSYDDNERLYLMLCFGLQDHDEEVVFTDEMFKELELARSLLKEKDAKIIELACFSNLSTMEIAQQMENEFEPALTTMNKKDIQTRISQWKNRAIVRLSGIITSSKNKHLFPCLLEYAKKKKL